MGRFLGLPLPAVVPLLELEFAVLFIRPKDLIFGFSDTK